MTKPSQEQPPAVEASAPPDKEEYVTIPKSELDAMITREEVEGLLKQQKEQMQEMIKSAITLNNGATTASPLVLEKKDVEEQNDNEGDNENNNDQDHDQQDQEFHTPFGETIYTLIYMSSSTSQSFWYGILVYLIQMTTILLTFYDRIHWDATENALQIPPMVDDIVTAAQGITIVLALAYQSDLIEAVLKLQDGFYPELLMEHPEATKATWLFSCLAQLVAGVLLLVVIFLLTMQVADVLSIMLNFAALHFMAEIDDLGFTIAKLGLLSNQLQKETHAVVDLQLPLRHDPLRRRNLWGRFLFMLTMMILFVLFALVKSAQITGTFLPTYLYVQFGDAYNRKIPYYSGLMTSGQVNTLHHREYHDIGTDGDVLLSWCEGERAWTFSTTTGGESDPCKDYFAKSSTTNTYDVSSLKDSDWEVKDDHGRLQPFDSFSLVDRDCNPETCQGTCGGHDKQELCQCSHDQFGLDCEFHDVCPSLIVDQRFDPFPAAVALQAKPFAVGDEFNLLQNPTTGEYVRVYNMPVYYSNKTYPANILFFGGRRWILTSEWDLIDMKKAKEENPQTWYFPEKTIATLEHGFHGYHQANYTPFFISDPVDFKTPDFLPDPIGLTWWTVFKGGWQFGVRQFKPDIPIDTKLICTRRPPSCVDKRPGFCGGGVCSNVTGKCDCGRESNFYGARCELVKPCFDQLWPCTGNGVCDDSTGTCRCNAPYYGKLCEQTQKCYEERGHCHNGGICNMTSGDCICPNDPAIKGQACEKTRDCDIVGCQNNGICGLNGRCICPPPFHGAHCHLLNTTNSEAFCSLDADCRNGTCDLDTGICDCQDPTSYGALCQYQYNCSAVPPWAGSPCLNSGVCSTTTGVCDCPDPYFGPDCSKVRPCKNNNDCGGKNRDKCDIESGKCICFGGLVSGPRCELPWRCRTSTREYSCYNGGTCNEIGSCQCPTGYSGTVCQFLVASEYDQAWDDIHRQQDENIRKCGFADPFCYDTDLLDNLP